jgi:Flp pilus assembly protein TadG
MWIHRFGSEKGSAMMEFGLVMGMLIPMLFGGVAFGVNLGNYLQSVQIARDVAHMYARGLDFSTTQNQNIAVNLAKGMGGMTTNGGNGVLILSQIREIYLADCTGASLTAAQCTNLGQRVFSNRLIVGNSTLRTSNFGTPNGSCVVTANGNISTDNYLKQTGCRASNFDDTVLPQLSGDIAYVVESYFATPSLGFLGAGGMGTYTRAIF